MRSFSVRVEALELANPWKIAGRQSARRHQTVIVEWVDAGVRALGEAAPAALYGETASGVAASLRGLDHRRLSLDDVPGSLRLVASLPGLPMAARCALNLALLDGAAKRARQPLHAYLGLAFQEHHHLTSFSLGIDTPEIVRQKTLAAAAFPVLKLKVGDPRDRENLAAVRAAAPGKLLRLDANAGWATREDALRRLTELAAADPLIQFVEQPMPRATPLADLQWLKERSPLPLFADESCHTVADVAHCAAGFHGVNVKLVKAGGLTMAQATLAEARARGLQTMLGCMIETSLQISAAAHLAALTDHLDLDGNLLITNDPFAGVTVHAGRLSFASAREPHGLRAGDRN